MILFRGLFFHCAFLTNCGGLFTFSFHSLFCDSPDIWTSLVGMCIIMDSPKKLRNLEIVIVSQMYFSHFCSMKRAPAKKKCAFSIIKNCWQRVTVTLEGCGLWKRKSSAWKTLMILKSYLPLGSPERVPGYITGTCTSGIGYFLFIYFLNEDSNMSKVDLYVTLFQSN